MLLPYKISPFGRGKRGARPQMTAIYMVHSYIVLNFSGNQDFIKVTPELSDYQLRTTSEIFNDLYEIFSVFQFGEFGN